MQKYDKPFKAGNKFHRRDDNIKVAFR